MYAYLVGSMREVHANNIQADYDYSSACTERRLPHSTAPLRRRLIFAAELVFGPSHRWSALTIGCILLFSSYTPIVHMIDVRR